MTLPFPNSINSVYRFFEVATQGDASSYAALLDGGTLTPSVLNTSIHIGLQPDRVITLVGNTLTTDEIPHSISTAKDLLTELRRQTKPNSDQHPWFTYAGYEFARWCDPGLAKIPPADPHSTNLPDLILCQFSHWISLDLTNKTVTLKCDTPDHKQHYQTLWRQACDTSAVNVPNISLAPDDYRDTFEASYSPAQFKTAVERLKHYIHNGEIYQANLSLKLQKEVQTNPMDLYRTLSHQNPSPFSACLKTPQGYLLSNSPERLVCANTTDIIETRPIAGTRGRANEHKTDETIGHTLKANPKERAEHLMLVDLARNDLGRVSLPGSVKVEELMTLERYSHVTHLVSNVTGQRRPTADVWDILKAVFPGGTITGCPKIRCMDLLHQTEPVPRGFYTGSLGWLDPQTNTLDLNILIRSLLLTPTDTPLGYNTAVHIGAGIVADSVAANEYRECMRKAQAILAALHHTEHPPQKDVQGDLHFERVEPIEPVLP
ncbi:MAG: anthranilate synthase component I family protein [Vampirovibrio sp.]|nr:anthranilate synthase component I family protein [Vampirovibrio sp.]